MNKNQLTKDKVCAFYASDYHFEMMSLPYIEKKLEENKKIIILPENNLEDTIKVLLDRMNLKEDKKNNIINIDWKQSSLNKFKSIKRELENNQEVIIFVKGKNNYIKNINKNLEKWTENNEDIKVIDCYDINEITQDMDIIMEKYQKVLNTSGEKEIDKI